MPHVEEIEGRTFPEIPTLEEQKELARQLSLRLRRRPAFEAWYTRNRAPYYPPGSPQGPLDRAAALAGWEAALGYGEGIGS